MVRKSLEKLFERTFGGPPETVVPLRGDGSDRRLFRLTGGDRRVIGVACGDHGENAAFVGFSRHFRAVGLPVPKIIALSEEEGIYLETDFGDITLADAILAAKERGEFPEAAIDLLRSAVTYLPRFQVEGHKGLDYSLCHQSERFGPDAMVKDLDYFRRCFLDLFYDGPRDDGRLDVDFRVFAERLGEAPSDFFLYRDFQPRNMMVVEGGLRFIDYQAGRRGAPQYDLAAFLYASSSSLDRSLRDDLTAVYLGAAKTLAPIDAEVFFEYLPGFALIRILQALGAYGNLGANRGKTRFLRAIPGAVDHLGEVLGNGEILDGTPALRGILMRMARSPERYVKASNYER